MQFQINKRLTKGEDDRQDFYTFYLYTVHPDSVDREEKEWYLIDSFRNWLDAKMFATEYARSAEDTRFEIEPEVEQEF